MKNMEKYMSLLNGEVDGLLLTSRYSRHYGAEFDIAEGVAIVTKAGCRYFTDSRYIESAENGIKDFEVQIVDGVDGCEVKFAKCCNPLPGDRIVGFITKGFGISIHKQDCPNVDDMWANKDNRERFINAYWDQAVAESKSGNESMYEAHLQIFAENDIMLLANITRALADMKVVLHAINTQNKDGDMVLNLTISCKNTDHFKSIIGRIKSIDKVSDVKRGYA